VPSFKQWWDSQIGGFSSDNSLSVKIPGWRIAGVTTLYKAGVPLLAGTDLGFAYVYPGDLAQELELFVQAGLVGLDALRTATINPARYSNMDKDLGSMEPGKIADLVLLDDNPIEDFHGVRLGPRGRRQWPVLGSRGTRCSIVPANIAQDRTYPDRQAGDSCTRRSG
jgi:hypothetical protein